MRVANVSPSSTRHQMLPQLPEDALENPSLHSLPKNLHRRAVVPGGKFTAVKSFNLALAQKSRPKRGLHKRPRVDLVIRLGDDGKATDLTIHDAEGKAVSGGLMAGVVDAKSFDGARNACGILAVAFRIGMVEIGGERGG